MRIDGHIHIERGPYTLEWIKQFVDKAVEMELDEIRLLEHNFIFEEFACMYDEVCEESAFVKDWFQRKAAFHKFDEYLKLVDEVRNEKFTVDIKFGLEICYFKEHEAFIDKMTRDKGLDFMIGSIHFVDKFAFDHTAELWKGRDVDKIYRRYFEDSVDLVRSGLFSGIGHPDTIKLFGHKPSFPLTEYYEKLAKEISKVNMYADQNSGAYRRNPNTASLGMNPELISILKNNNVKFITSSDAHCPEEVGYMITELEQAIM